MRLHGDAVPVGTLHMEFLHHAPHVGGLVLILRITLGALAEGDVVSLLVIGEEMRPQCLFRDADGRLADIAHGRRGAVEVEQHLLGNRLHHILVVVVAARDHTYALLLAEMFLHPRAETGQRGRDGRDAERDALQRRVAPRLVVGREHRKVETDQQIIVFHVEDSVLTVKVNGRIDHFNVLFR